MSILSDKDIKECVKTGDIIIRPFNEKNLSPSSYDVRLGEFYYKKEFNLNHNIKWFNPYNQEQVNKLWILKEAQTVTDDMVETYKLKKGSKYIIVPPRETILAHTIEFIGGVNNITTMMQCRSSYGRSCVTVCKCSGWGDVSFYNRYVMEIENCNNISVILTVGERIAQIVFARTGETEKKYCGSYQHTDDIEQLIKDWKPEMMLPRLKYD